MATNHRRDDRACANWLRADFTVATPEMTDALWSLAASEPERFIAGCLTAAKDCPNGFYLSDLPGWLDFKHSAGLHAQAKFLIELASERGIAENRHRNRRLS